MTRNNTREALLTRLRACIGPEKPLTYTPAEGWRLHGVATSTARIAKHFVFELATPVRTIEWALYHIEESEFRQQLQDVRSWIQGLDAQPANEAPLRQFLIRIAKAEPGTAEFEAHVWAMKQWIWQVKRQLLGKSVGWHLCPVFWSQTAPASVLQLVERIFEPLRGFSRHLPMAKANKRTLALSGGLCHVVFIDHLFKAPGVDALDLRLLINGSNYDGRRPHSSEGVHWENVTSCIGTSRIPSPHGFDERISPRHLWSIEVKDDVEMAPGFDPRDLWPCYPAIDDIPYNETPQDVREYMGQVRARDYSSKSPVELFWHERMEDAPGHELLFSELTPEIKTWAQSRKVSLGRMSAKKLRTALDAFLPYGATTSTNNYHRVRGYQLRGEPSGSERVVGGA